MVGFVLGFSLLLPRCGVSRVAIWELRCGYSCWAIRRFDIPNYPFSFLGNPRCFSSFSGLLFMSLFSNASPVLVKKERYPRSDGCIMLRPTTACPSASHSHWNHPVFGKLFYAFDLCSGNIGCWRSNRLALAINYDTDLVSVLFEMRNSGGFPTLPFRSFLFGLIFGPLCLYKGLFSSRFFSRQLIHIACFSFTC